MEDFESETATVSRVLCLVDLSAGTPAEGRADPVRSKLLPEGNRLHTGQDGQDMGNSRERKRALPVVYRSARTPEPAVINAARRRQKRRRG